VSSSNILLSKVLLAKTREYDNVVIKEISHDKDSAHFVLKLPPNGKEVPQKKNLLHEVE